MQVPAIVTPCHGASFWISTRTEGPAYLTYEVPDELNCSADGCYNTWTASGESDEYNRMPDAEEPA